MGWFKRHKVKDFVSPLQEKREALGDSMKDLLDGRTIVDGGLKRNLWFILYLAGLGLAYISVGYYTEGLYMRRVELEGGVVHAAGGAGEGGAGFAFRVDHDGIGVDGAERAVGGGAAGGGGGAGAEAERGAAG